MPGSFHPHTLGTSGDATSLLCCISSKCQRSWSPLWEQEPVTTRFLPDAYGIFSLFLHPIWVVHNRLLPWYLPCWPCHLTLSSLSLSSIWSKHSPIYKGAALFLLPCLSLLKIYSHHLSTPVMWGTPPCFCNGHYIILFLVHNHFHLYLFVSCVACGSVNALQLVSCSTTILQWEVPVPV